MMEATHHNPGTWLVYVILCISCVLSPSRLNAQSVISDQQLETLLDSVEILKLVGSYNKAISSCIEAKEAPEYKRSKNASLRILVELADIYRIKGDSEVSKDFMNEAIILIDTDFEKQSPVLSRYNIYKAQLIEDTYGLEDTIYQDSIFFLLGVAEHILDPNPNPRELAKLYFEKGRIWKEMNHFDSAEFYFSRLQNLLVNDFESTEYLRGWYFYYLSDLYYDLGDYERAILFSKLAMNIFSIDPTLDPLLLVKSELYLANSYYSSDNHELALEHYNNLLSDSSNTNLLNYDDMMVAYLNRSPPLLNLGEYEEAKKNSLESILLNRKKDNWDSLLLYHSYNSLAESFQFLEQHKEAERYFEKSIQARILTNGEFDDDTYFGYKFYGNYLESIGNYDKSLVYLQKAIISLLKEFTSMNIYDDPDYLAYDRKELIIFIIFNKASVFYKRYKKSGKNEDLIASYDLYLNGFSILNELINSGLLNQSILQKFETLKQQLNFGIGCALQLYTQTKEQKYFNQAFQFIENSKYFLLHRELASSEHKFTENIPDSLFYKRRELERDIISLNLQLEPGISTDSSFEILNELIEKLNTKAELEKKIYASGIVSNKVVVDSLLLDIFEVQHDMLKENELIVEFHWSENSIYTLIIGKDFTDVYDAPITIKLTNHIQTYLNLLSEAPDSIGYTRENYEQFIFSSSLIYDQLMKPVLEKAIYHMGSIEKINRVILVPDGVLASMPFEALLTDNTVPEIISYWVLPYLAKDITISYCYSLNILKSNLMEKNQIPEPGLLGFSYSSRLKSKSDIAALRSSNELPYSFEELNRIKSRIKRATFFTDNQASEEAFKMNVSDYTLLHLALHGSSDTTDIFNSKLIFKENEGSSEDGELHAYELYTLDLSNTELAVLSACETGLGKQSEGEGIFSIARGFAYAGCPAIVMSLWKVNDKATADLMDNFYKFLAMGFEKDKALRQAKLLYIENSSDFSSHPRNWAAFVALGNNTPIQIPKPYFSWYYWIIVFLLVLGALVLVFKLGKRYLPSS